MTDWEPPVVAENLLRSGQKSVRDPSHGEMELTESPRGEQDLDPLRQKIRHRYFNARFPDAPAPSEEPSAIIKAARLYFEDGKVETAIELLEYVADSVPTEERYWLAMLEISFLSDNAHAFVDAARRFRTRFPQSESWGEVSRLGGRIAPDHWLFGAGKVDAKEIGGSYGAWPEMPNWIEAPWDLTSEVLAVELRGRILGSSNPTIGKPR